MEALEKMLANGGILEWRAGAFWTWPACPFERLGNGKIKTLRGYRVPCWFAVTWTIKALQARRLVEPFGQRQGYHRAPRRLTPAGIRIARGEARPHGL
jgi:hypothetical protein